MFTFQAYDDAASPTLAEFPAQASHSVNTHTILLPLSKFFLLSQKLNLRDKHFLREADFGLILYEANAQGGVESASQMSYAEFMKTTVLFKINK